ncbi:MAG TPA: hypothetical protein VKS60_19780 [Stellaceae bacterium]|nr:hypothetical protein [Stellaceae bacterium]
MARPRYRVFISSPSDVRPERAVADRVIAKLARELQHHCDIASVLWEREPLVATHHFQDSENLPPPSTTDICVVVLWSRLGVPLPEDRFKGAVSGRAPVTGTEWEFEDAMAGFRAAGRPDLVVYQKSAEGGRLPRSAAELRGLLDQKEQLEGFVSRWFRDDATGQFRVASHGFASTGEFEERLEEHLRELLRRRLAQDMGAAAELGTISWTGAPYRGLAAFGPEEEAIFFGRLRARHEVRELLRARAEAGEAFVLVLGASGSGKSSLVKAGVLPDLRLPGMIGNVALVRRAIMRPSDADGDPVAGLAEAVLAEDALPELAELRYTAERLAGQFRENPRQAEFAVEQGLAKASEGRLTELGEARLLLVIDQLEELFTVERMAPAARDTFIATVAALTAGGKVWAIATMRSDFYDRLESLPALEEATRAGQYLLTPPTPAELRQIVRGPARLAGLRFEVDERSGEDLADRIVADAAAEPGALPLLSFALDQLWQARDVAGGVLTFSAYAALGGFGGALGQRAEAVFQALPDSQREAFPALLWALVTVGQGENSKPTARSAPFAALPPGSDIRRLAESLLAPAARLLVADGGAIRIAHEVLLTHWERAANQIRADREDQQRRSRLEAAAALWADKGEEASLLLHDGLPLSEAEDLAARRGGELDPALIGFIAASRAAVEARFAAEIERERRAAAEKAELKAAAQHRQARILRLAAAVSLLLAAAAGGAAWYGFASERRAERNLAVALDAADSVVNDVAEKLRPLVGVSSQTVHDILGTAQGVFDRLSAVSDDPEIRFRRAKLLLSLGKTYLTLGETERALDATRQSEAMLLALAAAAPGRLDIRRELADARDDVGDTLLKKGDVAGALPEYRAALGAREQATAGKPDPAWSRDLWLSHIKIGNALTAEGDLLGAMNEYQSGLAIVEAQAASRPDDAALQRDRSISLNTMGEVLVAQGDLAGALVEYRESLGIRQDEVTRDPKNAKKQRDLLFIHERIGGVLLRQGDLAAALTEDRAALEIGKSLGAHDAGNFGWQGDIADGHDGVGDVLLAQGDADGALGEYRSALQIAERLAVQDPANADWQHALWAAHLGIGRALKAKGDLTGALAEAQASRAAIERLSASDAKVAAWQHDLSTSRELTGVILLAQGDRNGAASALHDGLDIRTRLAAQDPTNSVWQRDLAASHASLGDVLMAQGDTAAALVEYRAGLAVAEALVAGQSGNAEGRRMLAEAAANAAAALIARHDLAAARPLLERARAIVASGGGGDPALRGLDQRIGGLSAQLDAAKSAKAR